MRKEKQYPQTCLAPLRGTLAVAEVLSAVRAVRDERQEERNQ